MDLERKFHDKWQNKLSWKSQSVTTKCTRKRERKIPTISLFATGIDISENGAQQKRQGRAGKNSIKAITYKLF